MYKPDNWDELPESHIGGKKFPPPPAAYVCLIIDAFEDKSKLGRDQLVLHLDIAEGDFAGFFKSEYDERSERGWSPKWGLTLYQPTRDKGAPFYKGLIRDIEVSNSYTVDWAKSANQLRGLKVGVIIDSEEYTYNGDIRQRPKARTTCKVKQVRDGEAPEAMIVGTDGKRRKLGTPPPEPEKTSDGLERVDDIDIPF